MGETRQVMTVVAPVCWGTQYYRVALGRYRPRAPTDPYVRALAHTVPRITDSLRDRRLNERCARGPADSAGQDVQTRSTSSSVRDCGG
jgi:hypothetical protein